jgi:hypothetical protein
MTMAPPADAFDRLRRCVALWQAGRPLPDDLAEWLTCALTAICRGGDAAAILGTRAAPCTRRPATRERYRQRDAAIAELFRLADGSQERRGGLLLEWHDGSRTPPAEAVPLLGAIEDAGLPLPDVRRVVEIATSAAARNGTAPPDRATLAETD